jgi:hypothetical protein
VSNADGDAPSSSMSRTQRVSPTRRWCTEVARLCSRMTNPVTVHDSER